MLERSSGERTYGQYCPVAAGLDLIGDRWVLLICRELVAGPRGFNEIKRALPGLASNLLATRLRTMSADGLIEHGVAGYRLSEDGRGVLAVLRAVARFGVRALDTEPPEPLDALRTARGFLLPWLRSRPMPPLVVIQAVDGTAADLTFDEDGVRLRAREPGVEPPGAAVVRLHVDPKNLVAVRREAAAFNGTIDGPQELCEVVLDAFALTRKQS